MYPVCVQDCRVYLVLHGVVFYTSQLQTVILKSAAFVIPLVNWPKTIHNIHQRNDTNNIHSVIDIIYTCMFDSSNINFDCNFHSS